MRTKIFIISIMLFLFSCEHKQHEEPGEFFYTCSMDPQVVSDKPGKCPICGMQLTAVKKTAVKNTDEIELSEQQIQLGNIRVDTIKKGELATAIELSGALQTDASQIRSVNARVMGRIEKLYVKTIGDYVRKGSPLYELYSEELNNARQEYVAALERKSLFGEQSLIDFERLIASARMKLSLWGMSGAQIKALENKQGISRTTTFYATESGFTTSLDVTEGSYVMEGNTIIQVADLSTLWAEAQVYSSQMYQVPKSGRATVRVPGTGYAYEGIIGFMNPEVTAGSRTNTIRVAVRNTSNQLKPGMPVIVNIRTANRNSLRLPTDAVIREEKGATVWLQTGPNKFRSLMVTTGLESEGFTEITSGLKEGDAVVVDGVYLLQSEFVFKRGTDPMASHNH